MIGPLGSLGKVPVQFYYRFEVFRTSPALNSFAVIKIGYWATTEGSDAVMQAQVVENGLDACEAEMLARRLMEYGV